MSDTQRNRLERDVEDALLRLRQLENAEAPVLKEHFAEFRELRSKVNHMDIVGTAVSARDIRELGDDIREVKEILKTKADQKTVGDMQEEQKAIRATVRSALITAAFSIASSIIVGTVLYVLLHGGTR